MSIPGVPPSKRRMAFRWLVSALRTNSALARLIDPDGWYVQEGATETADGGAGVGAELPAGERWAIRLTPTFEPETPIGVTPGCRRIWRSPVLVTIETRKQGDSVDDRADLWEAIEAALSPRSADVYRRLQASARAAGISWWEFANVGIGTGRDAASVGSIRLIVHPIR